MPSYTELQSLDDLEGLLPPVVQTLMTVLGIDAATDLVRKLGLNTVAVPKRETERGEAQYDVLVEIIGTEVADSLVRHFAGETLYIPSCDAALREVRYRMIRRDFDEMIKEVSARQAVFALASKHRYSDRQIWTILKSADRVGPAESAVRAVAQLGLF